MARMFSEEQIAMANSVDIASFLQMQGEALIKSGKDMRWARHTSITVRGNRFYDWKAEAGGYPIAFVQRYFNYNFKQAVEFLLSNVGDLQMSVPYEKTEKAEFKLPEKNETLNRVYGYLLKTRFLDKEVIDEFVRKGLIYEDKEYHNAVFVGLDENGVARHGHKRGTATYGKNQSFRGNIEGSDPLYPFHYKGSSNKVYVFEAPIDMLSYISLNKANWMENSYIALNGLSKIGLDHFLDVHPNINKIYLCLDHDIAGIEGAERISDFLNEKGSYTISCIRARNKDFNEDLKEQNNVEFIKSTDSPKYQEAMKYMEKVGTYGIVPGLDSIRELCRRLGDPQNDLKFVHIAGTNGKGSTLAYISNILQAAGYRVGKYISPVIIEYCEKIQIGKQKITHKDLSLIHI
mgnify:FL=1